MLKNFAILILFSLFFNSLNAQDSAVYIRRYDHTWRAFSISYGKTHERSNYFTNYFKNNYNIKYGNSLEQVCLEFGGPDNYLEDYYMNISYFPPSHLTLNDSINYTLYGFQYCQSAFQGVNLLYMIKNVAMPLSMGLNYGILFLKRNELFYRNPYFSISVQLKPRIIYHKWMFFATLNGNFDISKSKWKSKSQPLSENIGFKNTNYSVQVGIGYLLFDYKSGYIRKY